MARALDTIGLDEIAHGELAVQLGIRACMIPLMQLTFAPPGRRKLAEGQLQSGAIVWLAKLQACYL